MHYTADECHEMLPRWRENVERNATMLVTAIEAQDWGALRLVAVELRYAGTNLRGIADDLIEAEAHARIARRAQCKETDRGPEEQ